MRETGKRSNLALRVPFIWIGFLLCVVAIGIDRWIPEVLVPVSSNSDVRMDGFSAVRDVDTYGSDGDAKLHILEFPVALRKAAKYRACLPVIRVEAPAVVVGFTGL